MYLPVFCFLQEFLLKEEYRVLEYNLTTTEVELVNVSASWDEVCSSPCVRTERETWWKELSLKIYIKYCMFSVAFLPQGESNAMKHHIHITQFQNCLGCPWFYSTFSQANWKGETFKQLSAFLHVIKYRGLKSLQNATSRDKYRLLWSLTDKSLPGFYLHAHINVLWWGWLRVQHHAEIHWITCELKPKGYTNIKTHLHNLR